MTTIAGATPVTSDPKPVAQQVTTAGIITAAGGLVVGAAGGILAERVQSAGHSFDRVLRQSPTGVEGALETGETTWRYWGDQTSFTKSERQAAGTATKLLQQRLEAHPFSGSSADDAAASARAVLVEGGARPVTSFSFDDTADRTGDYRWVAREATDIGTPTKGAVAGSYLQRGEWKVPLAETNAPGRHATQHHAFQMPVAGIASDAGPKRVLGTTTEALAAYRQSLKGFHPVAGSALAGVAAAGAAAFVAGSGAMVVGTVMHLQRKD